MYKILLVEDEKVIRDGMKILLEDTTEGFTVLWEAPNGQRALEILKIDVPDVIVTDVRMPLMNGIDMTKYLFTQKLSIPTIIISGYGDFEYARQALRYGVKDYLLKPINRVELASTMGKIKNMLDQRRERPADDHEGVIYKIKDFVDDHLEGELSLQSISQAVNLHPNYISFLFKKETNENLSEYIINRRIAKAKRLLKESNLKIYDIARLVGYQSPKHFATAFKRHVQQTPYQFREGS